MASMGGFQVLAIATSAISLLVYLGVVLAVIKLRTVVPDHAHSFRIPGGYIVPVAACLAILWFLSHLTGREALALLILVLILTSVFFLKRFVEAKTAEPVRKKEIISEPSES
jgi:amino acid transporter